MGSNVVVRACITDFDSATKELGERIAGVAVTACDMVQHEETDLLRAFNGKQGIMILGLARRMPTPEKYTMMLIGFIEETSNNKFLDFWQLNEIFFSAGSSYDYREIFLGFLKGLGNQADSSLEKMLEHAYKDEVDWYNSVGCVVIWKQMGEYSIHSGRQCGVYVLAPSSVGDFKRRGDNFIHVSSFDECKDGYSVTEIRKKFQHCVGQQKLEHINVSLVVRCLQEALGASNNGTNVPLSSANCGHQKLLNVVNKFYMENSESMERASYKHLVIEYQLYLIERTLEDLELRGALVDSSEIECILRLLQKTYAKVKKFVQGNPPAVFQIAMREQKFSKREWCSKSLERMLLVVSKVTKVQELVRVAFELDFTFPEGMTELISSMNAPIKNVIVPPELLVVHHTTDLAAQLAMVEKNSPCVRVMIYKELQKSDLLNQFQVNILAMHSDSVVSVSTLQMVKDFEEFIFNLVDTSGFGVFDGTAKSRSAKQLQLALGGYFKLSRRVASDDNWIMHPEQQQSTSVLVAHCIYCMAFELCKIKYFGVMITSNNRPNYGVGLTGQKLRALLIPSGRLQRICLKIYRYLQENTQHERPLYLPTHVQATLDFGSNFVDSNPVLKKILEQENMDRQKRMHAFDVEQRRRDLEQYRLRLEISEVNIRLSRVEEEICETSSYEKKVRLRTEEKRLSSTLSQLEHDLKETLKPPETIIEPLPFKQVDMKSVLFLLHPPTLFRELASITFMAENSFIASATNSRSSEVNVALGLCGVPEGFKPWQQWYNSNRVYKYMHCSPESPPASSSHLVFLGYVDCIC